MFVKKSGYFFDMEAIKPVSVCPNKETTYFTKAYRDGAANRHGLDGSTLGKGSEAGRNFRNADIWFQSVDSPYGLCGVGDEMIGLDVTSEPYSGRHFATFPTKLVEPLILAATSAKGRCAKCRAPWKRVTEKTGEVVHGGLRKRADAPGAETSPTSMFRTGTVGTVGWEPGCDCNADVVPCVVLDPFIGSGTTAVAAIRNGRHCWGIDLSREYLDEHAVKRVMAATVWPGVRSDPLGKPKRIEM